MLEESTEILLAFNFRRRAIIGSRRWISARKWPVSQRLMRPDFVRKCDKLTKNMPQVRLAEHDEMVVPLPELLSAFWQ
jgi:hypothetical protein